MRNQFRGKSHCRMYVSCLSAAVLCAAACFRIPVRAGVVFEPQDRFYTDHADECSYLNRTCTAGEEAFLWRAPDSRLSGGRVKAGERVYISFVYTDEDRIRWGFADHRDQWILMADLFLPYTSEEFLEEYEAQIYAGEPRVIEAGTEFVKWLYPESGQIVNEALSFTDDLEIRTFYEDPDGRLWGYSYYFHGSRSIWICLSDPKDQEIARREQQEQEPAQTMNARQQALIDEKKEACLPQNVLLIGPAAAVLLAALILIRLAPCPPTLVIFRRKKRPGIPETEVQNPGDGDSEPEVKGKKL